MPITNKVKGHELTYERRTKERADQMLNLETQIGPIYVTYENISLIIISSIFLTIAYLFSVLTVLYAPLSLTSSTRYSVIVFGIILGYIVYDFLNIEKRQKRN